MNQLIKVTQGNGKAVYYPMSKLLRMTISTSPSVTRGDRYLLVFEDVTVDRKYISFDVEKEYFEELVKNFNS